MESGTVNGLKGNSILDWYNYLTRDFRCLDESVSFNAGDGRDPSADRWNAVSIAPKVKEWFFAAARKAMVFYNNYLMERAHV